MLARYRPVHQHGFSLIEVLISVLILAVGLLGAAAIQLNALKFTDSSTLLSQASFIAYDMMDRIRANPNAAYALPNLTSTPTADSFTVPRDQDWRDFALNIRGFAGTNGEGSNIVVNGRSVTIVVQWCDKRALNTSDCTTSLQSFSITSRVAMDAAIP
jgi:type IV pilus assembly protein PilV